MPRLLATEPRGLLLPHQLRAPLLHRDQTVTVTSDPMPGVDPPLTFRVAGTPATQGSKTGFVVNRKGGGKPRAVVVDKNPATLKPWREAVRSTALAAAGSDWRPLAGPVAVILRFALAKPGSAPKRRRTWPVGARSGDIDKLARSVLDALTDAGIWADDSQVVELRAIKDYPEQVSQMTPGVIVTVAALGAGELW